MVELFWNLFQYSYVRRSLTFMSTSVFGALEITFNEFHVLRMGFAGTPISE